jgi:hypothetical protein
MSYYWLFLERPNPVFRWPMQVLFALFAPVLALCIHSGILILRGFRLYNAELWVLFVKDMFGDQRIAIVQAKLFEALLTFLILCFVAKYPIRRWVMLLCCVALWVWLAFASDIAIK